MEAQVAQWFDLHNVRWYYESKRFYFEDCSYLPDFYLPDYDLYAEVKGMMRPEGLRRIQRFIEHHSNLLVVGKHFTKQLEVLISI